MDEHLKQLNTDLTSNAALSRVAEEAREREAKAVLIIQKYARGFLVRRRLDRLR